MIVLYAGNDAGKKEGIFLFFTREKGKKTPAKTGEISA